MLKAGIQVSSVKVYLQTPEDVRTSFEKFGAMGYTEAQLQWIGRDVPAADIAAALQAAGMKSWGVQDYFELIRADMDYYMGLCEATGGRYLCLSGIPAEYKDGEQLTLPGLRRMAEELNRLVEELAKKDMVATFHPRWQEYEPVEGKPATEWLMELTDPRFQLTLDLNHVVRAGQDPVEWILRYAGRQDMVHYKDMVDATREKSVLVPAGQGCLPGKEIFAACREAGVKVVFAEQESWSKDPFECLQESYEFFAANGIR